MPYQERAGPCRRQVVYLSHYDAGRSRHVAFQWAERPHWYDLAEDADGNAENAGSRRVDHADDVSADTAPRGVCPDRSGAKPVASDGYVERLGFGEYACHFGLQSAIHEAASAMNPVYWPPPNDPLMADARIDCRDATQQSTRLFCASHQAPPAPIAFRLPSAQPMLYCYFTAVASSSTVKVSNRLFTSSSVDVNGHSYGVGQLLVFTNGIDPVLTAKETCTLMLLGANHWANASSGGTSFHRAKRALSKPRPTGRRAASPCHSMTTPSFSPCLMTNPGPAHRHHPRRYRDSG